MLENEQLKIKTCRSDQSRIQQVLMNLISNAIKYSPKEECVRVQVYSSLSARGLNDPRRHMIMFEIVDKGPGISREDQKKIFTPFCKIEKNSELNPKSNGLGLSICRSISKKLGGDIEVFSTG